MPHIRTCRTLIVHIHSGHALLVFFCGAAYPFLFHPVHAGHICDRYDSHLHTGHVPHPHVHHREHWTRVHRTNHDCHTHHGSRRSTRLAAHRFRRRKHCGSRMCFHL